MLTKSRENWHKHLFKSKKEVSFASNSLTVMVQGPGLTIIVTEPAVAGRNALNPHPVYINWKQEHSRSADANPRTEVQQRVDHIKAKAIQNSPNGERQDYLRDLKNVHPPHSSSASESVSNPHINHSTLSIQPNMSRQPADFRPSTDYSPSHGAGAFHQPFGQDSANYGPTTPYGGAAYAHQSTQQTSPGHHQAYCPQPIDHLVFENLKYEQMKMMRAKDQAIYQFASAIDLAIKNMEDSLQSNNSDIKKIMDVAKIMLEKDDLARSQGNDESSYCGGSKSFDSGSSHQRDTQVLAPAQKRKVTGKHMLRYDTNYDLPNELTTIAENLSQTHMGTEHNIIMRLKSAKQTLGFAFENIGEQDVLPQGWIQHFSPK